MSDKMGKLYKSKKVDFSFQPAIAFSFHPELYYVPEKLEHEDALYKTFNDIVDIFKDFVPGINLNTNFLLFGERGLGKTSMLLYLIGKYRRKTAFNKKIGFIYMSPEIVKRAESIPYYILSQLKFYGLIPDSVDMNRDYLDIYLLDIIYKYRLHIFAVYDTIYETMLYARKNISYNVMLDTLQKIYERYIPNVKEASRIAEDRDILSSGIVNFFIIDQPYNEPLFMNHPIYGKITPAETLQAPHPTVPDVKNIILKRLEYIDRDLASSNMAIAYASLIAKYTREYGDGQIKTALNVARDVFRRILVDKQKDISQGYIQERVHIYSAEAVIRTILKRKKSGLVVLAGLYKLYLDKKYSAYNSPDIVRVTISEILGYVRRTARINHVNLYSNTAIKYHILALRREGVINISKIDNKGNYNFTLPYEEQIYEETLKSANIVY